MINKETDVYYYNNERIKKLAGSIPVQYRNLANQLAT
ncbi:IS3 family transposase [Leuconostoc mesenteroides]|nr:hypothetical protein FE417_07230 [Leuconostoc mesenteroides]KAA8377726.1 hypothetical protein FE413_06105 [Leuconostoc mesenteroides]MBA5973086.1 IS3 family transposase [Leuconostoc mesenteroides]MBZ1508973.1 IS3 family transposase [Leuconostoc mesenteroides]MBZ1510995.1 IS3 family transposase [Leuconostoc mesenteroides]